MIKPGIYRHFKGPLYLVEGVVRNASNGHDAQELVLYVPLELKWGHTGPRKCVRDLKEFLEEVEDPDWVPGDYRWIPRFEYLGPEITESMLKSRGLTDGTELPG